MITRVKKISKILSSLLIIGAIVSVLSLVPIFIRSISYVSSTVNNEEQMKIERFTETVRENIQNRFVFLNIMAKHMGSNDFINESEHFEDRYKMFYTSFIGYTNFKKFDVILPNGMGYSRYKYGKNYADKDFYKQIMDGKEYHISIKEDGVNENLELLFSVPIFNEKDEFIGILTANSLLEQIIPRARKLGTDYYLISENGEIIFSLPRQQSFSKENLIDKVIECNTNEKGEEFLKLLKGEKRGENLCINYDGKSYYAYSAPIGFNNWKIVSLAEKSVIVSPVYKFIAYTILPAVVIIAIFAMWTILFKKYMKKYELTLSEMTKKDSLTDLWNYKELTSIIDKVIKGKEIKNWIFVLDIKKFKIVNDTFGFKNGDKSLVEIAQILHDVFKTENIARISDDNFLILMKGITYDDVNSICRNVVDKIGEINSYEGFCMKLVPSIGVYHIESNCKDASAAVDRAIIARAEIKDSKISTYAIYDEMFREKLLNERQIEDEMQSALENGEFKVYLQPKIDIIKTTFAGAEALIRWEHPEKGLISPIKFIPLFEKNGFIVEIDKFVLRTICKYLETCTKNNIPVVPISVNISRVHLKNNKFVDEYDEIVSEYDFDRGLLEFELTENVFMDNFDVAVKAMKDLKERGYCLSMDDFGSEYSSLGMLQSIPINVLKLDRSFFNDSSNTTKGKVVIKNIVNMAKELDIKVVAEGVEIESQADFLKEIGCDMAQGFYYAKPMPIDRFTDVYVNTQPKQK